MCVQLYKIKSSSPYGQKSALIPCGKCEECRDSMRNQWFFRLRTELDWCHKNGFHIGFFTLTYAEDRIPRVPLHLIGNKDKITSQYYDTKGVLHKVINPDIRPYCFSRSDVRTFIDNIRKRVFEIVGKTKEDRRIRYMICSEYGSNPERTQRSHYHGLICFPKEISPDVMFKMIHNYWSVDDPKLGLKAKGFVYPRYITGGRDSQGYLHQPFLLQGDVSKAARYAAKYCTKDLNFHQALLGFDVDTKHPDFKDCKCFHIQSKSIGLSYLSTLPNDKLLDILQNGVSFLGDTRRRSLPLYLKRKIIFNPLYQFEESPCGDWYYDFETAKWRYSKFNGTHRRLVRKEASAFFYRNAETIYNMKVDYYVKLFKDMQSVGFWQARVNPKRCTASKDEIVQRCLDYASFMSCCDVDKLARGYLSYFGVPYECAKSVPFHQAYLMRYTKKVYESTFDEFEPWSGTIPCINRSFYDMIQKKVGFALDALRWCENTDYEKRERVARVSDFYKHAI